MNNAENSAPASALYVKHHKDRSSLKLSPYEYRRITKKLLRRDFVSGFGHIQEVVYGRMKVRSHRSWAIEDKDQCNLETRQNLVSKL